MAGNPVRRGHGDEPLRGEKPVAHSHEADEGYFLDQIFGIALCGALGGIAVLLYVKQTMLGIILDPKFHPYVLAGGITLLILVTIRAIALWQLSGEVAKHTHDHHHEHQHDHGHSHDHAHDHDHAHHHHDHEHCDHEHGACGHDHHHAADHDHGHEHGWAPWRYTVLMLPIVLFLLNLPNSGFGPRYKDPNLEEDLAPQTVASTLGLLAPTSATGPLLASSLLYPGRNDRYGDGFVSRVDFHDLAFSALEKAGNDAVRRGELNGRSATIIGQFAASGDSNRFGLVRYRMNCCAADALPLNAVIMINPNWQGERLDAKARHGKWVQVTGRVYFLKARSGDDLVPAVIVFPSKEYPPNSLVEVIDQPTNPYVQ
jgi:hypothetical protein